MKFIKVSGVVLMLHGALATMLFFQSGCQTIENTQEPSPNVCPYVVEPQPIGIVGCNMPVCNKSQTVVVKDDFTEPCNLVIHQPQPMPTGRFKPMRPLEDFSNDGLLRSVEEVHDFSPKVVSFDEVNSTGSEISYTVKPGDSLWIIAKKHNVGVAEIVNLNTISRDSTLKVGQKLMIPVRASASSSNLSSTAPAMEGGTYTIAKGDTLSEIAHRFKVSVEAIKNANNLQNNNIFAGKKIIIPGVNSDQIASSASTTRSTQGNIVAKEGAYKVQNGDSLSVIANRFGVSVAELMTWNNISDARKLRAGQSLVVRNPNSPMTNNVMSESSISSFEKAEVPTNNYRATEDLSASNEEENLSFDIFEDEDLFGSSNEIPVINLEE
ncbi:MAG: hypothetical protein C5B43_00010 [Verrucomicrobia bacterium]|nr:MAG: hypothetical protein C5B43_00010 [Verrucomicrobiota bacterium]